MRCALHPQGQGAKHEQYEWPHKWEKSVLTYDVIIPSQDKLLQAKFRRSVGLAFTTWAAEIPVKFKRTKINPDIKIIFQNDSMADDYLKDKPTVLAYAYYPKTRGQGKIVFNDYKYEWGTRDQYVNHVHVYNFIHVLIHEIGHCLGLSHDDAPNSTDVMDAYYNGKVTELSANDILRIRKKYGIRNFSNWNLYTRLKNYLRIRKNKS